MRTFSAHVLIHVLKTDCCVCTCVCRGCGSLLDMESDDPWLATTVPSKEPLDLNSIKTADLLPFAFGILPPTCLSYPSLESLQSVPDFAASEESSLAEAQVPSLTPCIEELTGDRTVTPTVSLPSVDRYPGEYEFAVNISPCSKRVPNFSRELNTLFIHNQTSFAVEFHMLQEELPPNMYVRAMVCYSDPAHLAEHGPILPCSCNAHVSSRKPEYKDRYMISSSKAAYYSEMAGHRNVAIKLSNMQNVNGKYTAVYSFASYTSCLAKNTKMATVFTLMHGDKVEGRDMFYSNVCACPPRDMAKALERAGTKTMTSKNQRGRKRKRSYSLSTDDDEASTSMAASVSSSPSGTSLLPSLLPLTASDPDLSPYPDDDGFYDFRWRVRDPQTFFYLCTIKRSCCQLQQRLFQGHEERL